MPNKKLSKNYFGVNKTPIDDNTVVYLPLDGDTKEYISGQTLNLGTGSFKPIPTGLGYKFNADSSPVFSNSLISANQGAIDFWINFDTVQNLNSGMLAILDSNGYYSIEVCFTSSGNLQFLGSSTEGQHGNAFNLSYLVNTLSGFHNVRLTWVYGSLVKLYIDGNLKSSSSYTTLVLTPSQVVIGQSKTTGTGYWNGMVGTISDLSISNIDKGSYFPTLPQDFIDGYAKILPSLSKQRQVYSDALYSETKSALARIGTSSKGIAVSRTSGNWTSGDTIKVTGLAGEIISGVIDTDTAVTRVSSLVSGLGTTTGVVIVDNVSGINVNDTYNVWLNTGSFSILTWTITAISGNQITFTTGGTALNNADSYSGGFLFETTASSSSPLVKANLTGTAQAGASTIITLPSTFSSVDSTYNNYDIMITSGTGAGQRRTISAYVGSTKVATVPAWTTTPDSTSVFTLYGFPVTGTWTNLGTNSATFTLGTNSLLTNQDIEVDYSLNEISGQGQIELFTKTYGGEVNGKKLVNGTVAIRDDFSGKNSGSTVECPHISKYSDSSANAHATLFAPSSFVNESSSMGYSYINTLNGALASNSATTNGITPQRLFSFNIIRMFEDKYGEIPAPLDKVAYVKATLNSFVVNWYGYGSNNLGNRANLGIFNNNTNTWDLAGTNTNNSASVITKTQTNANINGSYRIDPNGYAHFLAYTDAAGPTNLLTANESNVETNTTGLSTLAGAVITRDTTEFNEGSASLKIICDGSVINQGTSVVSTALSPSQTYTFSVYLKGSGTVVVEIQEHDASDSYIGQTYKIVTLTNTWTRYTCTKTLTSTTSYIYGKIYTTTAQAVTFYADQLQLEAGSTASAWSVGGGTGTITPSTIYTDYIYLDLVLNTPTGYDVLVPENPRRDSLFKIKSSDMTRIADFNGKISGDTNRVAHISKATSNWFMPSITDSWSTEMSQASYSNMSLLDSTLNTLSTSANTYMAQQLFSFNLIRLIEDNYGAIPVADKGTWVKNNISNISCSWYGYGSCPSGNKANLAIFVSGTNSYALLSNNTSTYSTLLSYTTSLVSVFVDSNGFIHYLAYTDASNGVTASAINTDYISLSVTLKDSAFNYLPYFKNRRGNENILLVRKETKEVQTFFPSDLKNMVLYGETNKTSAIAASSLSTLAGGYVISNMKAFLTTLTTKLAAGSIYNSATKFDLLDDFSIIDTTISTSLTNGLNLFVNSSFANLVANMIPTSELGYSSTNKGIRIGKINTLNNTKLQLEDTNGNVVLNLDTARASNSVASYAPIIACLVKDTTGTIYMLVASANNSYKGSMTLDNTNGRILLYPLTNRPILK